ncbi:MAG TPA: M56 family metallopeptidase [Pirellulales bacterium]|nr:M56 family metallopeptidase [Pirellulales bacterium]
MSWTLWIVSNLLLAFALGLAARFTHRRLRRPALARALWILVLAKLLTPPLLSVRLGELPARLSCAIGACGCHGAPIVAGSEILPWAFFALWSVGAGATGWAAWRRYGQFRRLLAHGMEAPPEWQSLAARLSAELRLRRPPEIVVVPCRLPPLVMAGWHGPRVMLPQALVARLDDSQREALLLHELVHIRRLDHLVRLLELTVSVAYWWLPVLGSLGRQLRECEEACCDAVVLDRLPQNRREYAGLLLDVLDFVAPLPREAMRQATAMSAVHDLERRLRTILDAGPKRSSAWPASVLAIGLACAVLPCGINYEFPSRSPTATSPGADTCDGAEPSTGDAKRDPAAVSLAVFCCPS